MLTTNHLGTEEMPIVHPAVASIARELLNKSDNERSGVVSTAMSYLGLYRDPIIAANTARSDWRIADLMRPDQPVSLYHDSPYSISKIIGELYGNYYFQRHGLPFVKARFSNVYGPREILGAGQWRGTVHTVWRNVIPSFIWRSLHGEALPLDNGGNASRDFIFVEDMARGLMACGLRGAPGEVYNLATGTETTILELAKLINENTGNTVPPDLRPAREWDHSGKRFASIEKASLALDFRAENDIREGLRRTVEWTVANRELIAGCMARHRKNMAQVQNLRDTSAETN